MAFYSKDKIKKNMIADIEGILKILIEIRGNNYFKEYNCNINVYPDILKRCDQKTYEYISNIIIEMYNNFSNHKRYFYAIKINDIIYYGNWIIESINVTNSLDQERMNYNINLDSIGKIYTINAKVIE